MSLLRCSWSVRISVNTFVVAWVLGGCSAVVAQQGIGSPGSPGTVPADFPGNRQQTVAIPAPEGFPLSQPYQDYVDQVLAYWENSSGQVERLRCQFNRFAYDSGICNYVDPNTGQMVAHEIAGGLIKYEAPDRAIIEVDKKRIALPPNAQNANLEYRDLDAATMEKQRERYVSSGDAIFFFDYAEKQLIKQHLPQELQGQGIKNSPLPFLFGAKAEELKARYWIRPITPDNVQKQWWLEVYPKRRQDAEHYSRAVIVLGGDEFLPIQIQLFAPDHNPVKFALANGAVQPAVLKYQIYDFHNSEKNFSLGLNIVKLWRDEFSPRAQTLLGWKLVEKEAPAMAAQQPIPGGGDLGLPR
jgi:TIGR03009 family protein